MQGFKNVDDMFSMVWVLQGLKNVNDMFSMVWMRALTAEK